MHYGLREAIAFLWADSLTATYGFTADSIEPPLIPIPFIAPKGGPNTMHIAMLWRTESCGGKLAEEK